MNSVYIIAIDIVVLSSSGCVRLCPVVSCCFMLCRFFPSILSFSTDTRNESYSARGEKLSSKQKKRRSSMSAVMQQRGREDKLETVGLTFRPSFDLYGLLSTTVSALRIRHQTRPWPCFTIYIAFFIYLFVIIIIFTLYYYYYSFVLKQTDDIFYSTL